MVDLTWVFKPGSHMRGPSLAQLWKWQVRSTDGRIIESRALFSTLNQCVRDAQQHGFSGDVDPTEGTFTTSVYSICIAKDGAITFTPAK
jgi:hypothetical protein